MTSAHLCCAEPLATDEGIAGGQWRYVIKSFPRMKRLCLALLCFAATDIRAQFSYTVQDLGTLGGTTSVGTAVNNDEQVTGSSNSEDAGQQAFISGFNGSLPLRNLGTLGGAQSYGQAINSSGRVAGTSELIEDDSTVHAFLSGPNGGELADLATLGGTLSFGAGVNGAGQVVGDSFLAENSGRHAFLSGANGAGLNDLGTLPDGTNSFGLAVNASGQVTGYSQTKNESQAVVNHAFISDSNGASLRDLGTLGGESSFGSGLNDAGQVVGRSDTATFGKQHAFRSAPNGGPLIDLVRWADSLAPRRASTLQARSSVPRI